MPDFDAGETRRRCVARSEPSYQGTFTGARRYVLQTFATTQSALMKRRVARYIVELGLPGMRRQAADARGRWA